MLLKLRQLHIARQGINTMVNKPVKAKTAYCISKNKALINVALKPYDDTIDKLIAEYGKRPEDGSPAMLQLHLLPLELRVELAKQIDELLDVEEEVPIRMIPGSELEKLDMTPAEMETLEFMITVPEGWNE